MAHHAGGAASSCSEFQPTKKTASLAVAYGTRLEMDRFSLDEPKDLAELCTTDAAGRHATLAFCDTTIL